MDPTNILHIRFITEPSSEMNILRKFMDPVPSFAVAETIKNDELPKNSIWPEPTDELYLIFSSDASSAEAMKKDWLHPPDHPNAPLATTLSLNHNKFFWRPGRALIQGKTPQEDTINAIVEFAFYESELRKIEEAVYSHEKTIRQDVPFSYRIRIGYKKHLSRFSRLIEQLSLLQITLSHLEPHLLYPSRVLTPDARRIMSQLCDHAAIESRLETLNDRLEICIDLYEAAVDRMTDFRWYHRGCLLEIIIIILLLIEVVQLGFGK